MVSRDGSCFARRSRRCGREQFPWQGVMTLVVGTSAYVILSWALLLVYCGLFTVWGGLGGRGALGYASQSRQHLQAAFVAALQLARYSAWDGGLRLFPLLLQCAVLALVKGSTPTAAPRGGFGWVLLCRRHSDRRWAFAASAHAALSVVSASMACSSSTSSLGAHSPSVMYVDKFEVRLLFPL